MSLLVLSIDSMHGTMGASSMHGRKRMAWGASCGEAKHALPCLAGAEAALKTLEQDVRRVRKFNVATHVPFAGCARAGGQHAAGGGARLRDRAGPARARAPAPLHARHWCTLCLHSACTAFLARSMPGWCSLAAVRAFTCNGVHPWYGHHVCEVREVSLQAPVQEPFRGNDI